MAVKISYKNISLIKSLIKIYLNTERVNAKQARELLF